MTARPLDIFRLLDLAQAKENFVQDSLGQLLFRCVREPDFYCPASFSRACCQCRAKRGVEPKARGRGIFASSKEVDERGLPGFQHADTGNYEMLCPESVQRVHKTRRPVCYAGDSLIRKCLKCGGSAKASFQGVDLF